MQLLANVTPFLLRSTCVQAGVVQNSTKCFLLVQEGSEWLVLSISLIQTKNKPYSLISAL